MCLESSNLHTALTQVSLSYQPQREALQLNQLPDALFNSQLNRAEPIQALLRFDTANFMEASMIKPAYHSLEFCYASTMETD